MKNRFSLVDLRAIIAELQKELIGLRLANIYDLNQKTYIFKFAEPDHKVSLLIESGIRMHTTQFNRDKSVMPSPFTLKLRKHIRTRRVEKIEQLGVDRVVDFTFGEGEKAFHIIVEFYAKGNLILTDHEYKIIVLLRAHKREDEAVYAVGEVYPTARKRQFSAMTREKLINVLQNSAREDQDDAEEKSDKEGNTLKNVLNNNLDYGPGFAEHCILQAGLKPNLKITTQDISDVLNDAEIDSLTKAFHEADAFILSSKDRISRGYIILSDGKKTKKPIQAGITTSFATPSSTEQAQQQQIIDTTQQESNQESPESLLQKKKLELEKQSAELDRVRSLYDDFAPFPFKQFQSREHVEYPSFDKCVDEFFSALEARKIDSQKSQLEKGVMKKLEKIKSEQLQRVEELQNTQDQYNKMASMIEENLDSVDEAIQVICSAVAQAYDWEEIKRIIKEQKKDNNPIAKMIQQLKLETNQITLLLKSHDDDDESHSQPQAIDVDINMSAYANAQHYYNNKKKSAHKQQKTMDASKKVIKIAEKKSIETLKQQQIKQDIVQMRRRLWFEKFNWFITSENYLVLSGRDAQQNELLVKRYMRKGDAYVHADVHGASTCIVKNHNASQPIPPLSLQEAGMMTVCRSAAWDNKIVTNSWWVNHDQVSKSAPTGEYLSTGSFMIRGKKNFLPPSSLIMGLSVMFFVDDSCIPNHLNERKVRGEGDDGVHHGENDDDEYDDDLDLNLQTKNRKKWDERIKQQELEQELESCLNDDDEDDDQNGHVDDQQQQVSTIANDDDDQQQQEQDTKQINGNDQEEEKDKKTRLNIKDKKKIKQLKKKGLNDVEAIEAVMNQEPTKKEPISKKKAQKTRKQLQQELANLNEQQQQQQNGEDSLEEEEEDEEGEEKQEANNEQQQTNSSIPTHKPAGMKKGKWKKLKGKYAHQDEDERKLRMELLGHKYMTIEDRKREKEQEERKILEDKLKKQEKEERQKKKEKEEIKKLLAEENIPYMDDEDREKLTEIDSLTGQPREDDIILFCIPVCAPYSSMKSYKYKVKILPGSTKRGKAAKLGANMLINDAKAVEKEYQFVKSVPDTEVTAVMVPSARIASKGVQNAKKKAKK
ncbi:nuclear export mediator factor NEMF [Acrasis kona]|uniref:Nuclear export mediator factor NEMF n=1 Tax=Acrasis kona TaxID=1008807 RepID=A0AAW2YPZ5_9EUKA